jgi:hypothetical protein
MAEADASQCVEAAMPNVPRKVGRVVNTPRVFPSTRAKIARVALVPVDLPPPVAMRDRWAAFAAVAAAVGSGDVCHAGPGARWHYDDSGGAWADLVHVGRGRAVLVGWERGGDTYFRGAAEYFERPATDLLAGAPDWWAEPVADAEAPFHWVGFVYGFDGERWWRAAYDADDGFARLGLPAVDEESCRDACAEFCDGRLAESESGNDGYDGAALDAVLAAGVGVTEAQLRALLGADGDPAAGAAAARAFS